MARIALLVAYATLVGWLTIDSLRSVAASGLWSQQQQMLTALTVVAPAVMLLLSVLSKAHSLAWSVFWTWSLIFMGLAPAYQLGQGKLPWGAAITSQLLSQTQLVVIVGYVVAIAAFATASARIHARSNETAPAWNHDRARRVLTAVVVAHVLICMLFVAFMGPALFTGREIFSERLVALSGTPGAGTTYFLASAGAVIVPGFAITLRKQDVKVPLPLLWLSIAMSFIVTNPLIGSRFLTGSFLVAVVAASVGDYVRRWLPAGVILLFVTVFPTLDLLRGNGTGSHAIAITDPSTTLTNLDFDSFAMTYRAVSLHGMLPNGYPSRTELLVAPLLRWIPFVSPSVRGDAAGPAVASATGMGFTNVSMPVWGEADLLAGWVGVGIAFAILGILLALTRRRSSRFGLLLEAPAAALLFIVLRGSLYEVLGYLILAVFLAAVLARVGRPLRSPPEVPHVRQHGSAIQHPDTTSLPASIIAPPTRVRSVVNE